MNIRTLKNNEVIYLKKFIDDNTKVIIIKKYVTKYKCQNIINYCHNHFKKKNDKNFYTSIDILPKNVKTDRIFRTFIFRKFFDKEVITKLINLQKKYINNNIPEGYHRRIQIIHYPIGGGFFDWHKHDRFPTNYGLILNLSKKNNFSSGLTEFKYKNNIIHLKNQNIDAGDLILFRYDLVHKVSVVDIKKDLTFNKKGRWTLILPILKNIDKVI